MHQPLHQCKYPQRHPHIHRHQHQHQQEHGAQQPDRRLFFFHLISGHCRPPGASPYSQIPESSAARNPGCPGISLAVGRCKPPQLVHITVQIPYVVDKLPFCEKRPGVRQQLIQQQKLLSGQLPRTLRSDDLQGAAVQHRGAHRQASVCPAAIPPQQGLDTPKHLLLVHWFDHIVIRPRPETPALVLLGHAGRHHQHRQIAVPLPQRLGEGDAVHPRHSDIHHRQIALVVFHHLQRLHTVPRRARLVPGTPQHLAHQKSGVVIVLGHQNAEHGCPSLVFFWILSHLFSKIEIF